MNVIGFGDDPSPQECVPGRRMVWALSSAFLIQFFVFAAVAHFRFVDGDEGAYLTDCRLLIEGQVPYLDFFYSQTPFFLYAYSGWLRIFGVSLYSARIFSAVLAALTGTLLFGLLARWTARVWPGWLAVLLYLSSGQVCAWQTILKTTAISTVLAVGALFLLQCEKLEYRRKYLLAGLLLGLCVSSRIVFAALFLPACLWALLDGRTGSRRWTRPLWLAGGFLAGLSPLLMLLSADPDRVIFDVLRVHSMRIHNAGLGEMLVDKVRMALMLAGLIKDDSMNGPQFGLLLLLQLVAAFSFRPLPRQAALCSAFAATLGLAFFVPNPSFSQYFAPVVPFLIPGAVLVVFHLWNHPAPGQEPMIRSATRPLAVLLSAAYILMGAGDYSHYLRSGSGVPGLMQMTPVASDLKPANLRRVSEHIAALVRPGEEVISTWPGYIVDSPARPVPRLNDHFCLFFAALMDAPRARHYLLLPKADLITMIRERTTRVVVVGHWTLDGDDYSEVLRLAGYELSRTMGGARIYVLGGQGHGGLAH
jgi:hypothetical protein